jgi:hypothetical protein
LNATVENGEKMKEVISLLPLNSTIDPDGLLLHAIALEFLGDTSEASQILVNLPHGTNYKSEFRRLYWGMRIFRDLGQITVAVLFATQARDSLY